MLPHTRTIVLQVLGADETLTPLERARITRALDGGSEISPDALQLLTQRDVAKLFRLKKTQFYDLLGSVKTTGHSDLTPITLTDGGHPRWLKSGVLNFIQRRAALALGA